MSSFILSGAPNCSAHSKSETWGRDVIHPKGVDRSRAEAARPLMSPDEIRLMPTGQQILLIQSYPPILAQRVPFWTVAPRRDWATPNPVEGAHPRSEPTFRMTYREKRND